MSGRIHLANSAKQESLCYEKSAGDIVTGPQDSASHHHIGGVGASWGDRRSITGLAAPAPRENRCGRYNLPNFKVRSPFSRGYAPRSLSTTGSLVGTDQHFAESCARNGFDPQIRWRAQFPKGTCQCPTAAP